MNDAVIKHEQSVAAPNDLLGVIAAAVANPLVDVEKMRALLDMQKEIVADQRKVAWDEAMSRLQAKLPQIDKYGQAKNSKFAKYEDLDIILKPLTSEEGFSLSFNEAEHTADTTTFVLEVSRAGHTKSFRRTFHNDKASMNREGKGIRPAIQDDGSTTSYARRYLLKMAFNIVEKNEDTDGDSLSAISPDQAKDLEALAEEVKADKKRFLLYMNVDAFASILQRDLQKATSALQAKARK